MELTQDYLKSILYYNSFLGIFVWREDRPRAKKGGIATKSHRGYQRIFINGKYRFAHRLAWLYMYGEWPKQAIDHINHNGTDNRICNLRDVSNAENGRNRKGGNKILGLSFIEKYNSWQVYIGEKYVGLFKDKKEAIKARKKAERLNNYHKNHSGESYE